MALTNNDILKKLRVALELRDDDILEILGLVDFKISKSELGAMFRREDHPNYMEAGDQILRNFLNGLVIYKRGPMERGPVKKAEYRKPSGKNTKAFKNQNTTKKGSSKPQQSGRKRTSRPETWIQKKGEEGSELTFDALRKSDKK